MTSYPSAETTHALMLGYRAPVRGRHVSGWTFEAHVIDANGDLIVQRVDNFRAHAFVANPGYRVATQLDYDRWSAKRFPDSVNAAVTEGKLFPLANLGRFYDALGNCSSMDELIALIVELR